MREIFMLCLAALLVTSVSGQDLKSNQSDQEPYFYEIVERKEQEINRRILENGGSTKDVGLNSFNRWRAYWEPRVGKYGKFSEIKESAQSALKLNSFNCVSSADWTEIGPSSFPAGTSNQRGLGRLDFVKLHPNYNGTTNQTLYAGGRPGLWRSTNDGDNWTHMNSDEFDMSVCSDIGVMTNFWGQEILLAATGIKKDHDDPTRSSLGLKRSTNGGNTWTTIDLESTPWEMGDENRITEIAVDPNANNRVYVSVSKFSWTGAPDYFGTTSVTDNYIGKLFVSENYGLSWTKIYEGFVVEDIEFKTNDSSTFYFSGHKLVEGVRLGTNNYSFTDLTAGLSGYSFNDLSWNNGHAQRMEVEVTNDNSNVVYVFSQYFNSGSQKRLWKSTNAGATFSLVSSTNFPLGITWRRGTLEVSHQDENLLYLTGVQSGRSTNGGVTWTDFSGVHVDTMDAEVSSTNQVFLANDAGVYRSTDNGLSWQVASEGLGVAEIYDIGMSLRTSNSVPDIIEGGFQDTNCMVRLANGNWAHSTGTSGDGMVCIVDPVDPNIVYSESQNGGTRRSTNGGVSFSGYSVGGGSGLWVTPMVLDPNNHDRLLVGKSQVRVRTAGGPSSELTIPFSVANSQKISALKVAPSNSNVIYVAYELGIAEFDSGSYPKWWEDPNRKMREQLFKTVDGGATWTDVSPADLTQGSHGIISSIEVHSSDPDKVWVTYGAYGSKYHAIRSTNGGSSWANYSQGLEEIPANDIVITPTHNNSIKRCDFLYLATDFGIYYRSSKMKQWECYSDGIPNLPVLDLEIDEYQSVLRCATFGRGVWETALHPDDKPYNDSHFSYSISCGPDGKVSVTVTPNDPTPNQWWGVFQTTTPFQTGDSYTIGQIGSSQCCGGGSKTFTGLDENKHYYVKHGVWDLCHKWQETREYIPMVIECDPPAFDVNSSKTSDSKNLEELYVISPNPSKGVFTLKTKENISGLIEVFDQTGSLLFRNEMKQTRSSLIDLSEYAIGLYYLKLTVQDNVITKQLMKK